TNRLCRSPNRGERRCYSERNWSWNPLKAQIRSGNRAPWLYEWSELGQLPTLRPQQVLATILWLPWNTIRMFLRIDKESSLDRHPLAKRVCEFSKCSEGRADFCTIRTPGSPQ